MSDDTTTGAVETAGEFQRALSELLTSAGDAGVEVQGAWVCDDGEDGTGYEVEVVELLVED
jgi:hypothetical protein